MNKIQKHMSEQAGCVISYEPMFTDDECMDVLDQRNDYTGLGISFDEVSDQDRFCLTYEIDLDSFVRSSSLMNRLNEYVEEIKFIIKGFKTNGLLFEKRYKNSPYHDRSTVRYWGELYFNDEQYARELGRKENAISKAVSFLEKYDKAECKGTLFLNNMIGRKKITTTLTELYGSFSDLNEYGMSDVCQQLNDRIGGLSSLYKAVNKGDTIRATYSFFPQDLLHLSTFKMDNSTCFRCAGENSHHPIILAGASKLDEDEGYYLLVVKVGNTVVSRAFGKATDTYLYRTNKYSSGVANGYLIKHIESCVFDKSCFNGVEDIAVNDPCSDEEEGYIWLNGDNTKTYYRVNEKYMDEISFLYGRYTTCSPNMVDCEECGHRGHRDTFSLVGLYDDTLVCDYCYDNRYIEVETALGYRHIFEDCVSYVENTDESVYGESLPSHVEYRDVYDLGHVYWDVDTDPLGKCEYAGSWVLEGDCQALPDGTLVHEHYYDEALQDYEDSIKEDEVTNV